MRADGASANGRRDVVPSGAQWWLVVLPTWRQCTRARARAHARAYAHACTHEQHTNIERFPSATHTDTHTWSHTPQTRSAHSLACTGPCMKAEREIAGSHPQLSRTARACTLPRPQGQIARTPCVCNHAALLVRLLDDWMLLARCSLRCGVFRLFGHQLLASSSSWRDAENAVRPAPGCAVEVCETE